MPQGNERNRVLLIIIDGLGVAPASRGNAVSLAKPQNLIKYWDAYPHTYLKASGEAVGLPTGVYGNSEVGHMNIGSGKVILQNLPKINKAIKTGAFFSNKTLEKILVHARQNNSAIHLMGCLSDGSVHAHTDHFIAVLEYFARQNYNGKLYIHAFTDGRDTSQTAAAEYLAKVQKQIDRTKVGFIASICGRAFAMDRNNKWKRTQKAYNMLVSGAANNANNWSVGLKEAYGLKQTDEYIEPIMFPDQGNLPTIKVNDAVIYMNYRSDRALQLTDAFIQKDFSNFPVQTPPNLFFASMVAYRKDFPTEVLMPKEYINLSIGRVVSETGLKQLRIAESEKFPHVTYFFNGGLAVKYPGEDRIEIQSPNVPTYDLKPEMSAIEVTQALEQRIDLMIYDFFVLNLANTDMVGHTGNLEACIKAVTVVDNCVDRLVKRFVSQGGTVVLTADHGNVEEVIKLDSGEIDTEHSLNPVPFIIVNRALQGKSLRFGSLADIAPTILQLMNITKPDGMSGISLLQR